MPTCHGISPQPVTRQAAEAFENSVIIRKNGRLLVAAVYLDMQDGHWGVAVAYNPSRNPGLSGHDNLLEVRYTFRPGRDPAVIMMRSDPYEESEIAAVTFDGPDAFARFALDHERSLVNRMS